MPGELLSRHELIFRDGTLRRHEDVSARIEEIRAEMVETPGTLRAREGGMRDWVERCFRRDYRL